MADTKPLPPDEDITRLDAAGLVFRDDGPTKHYWRWAVIGYPIGVVYDARHSLPWGVYWGVGGDRQRMAFTNKLDTAIELLELIARVV